MFSGSFRTLRLVWLSFLLQAGACPARADFIRGDANRDARVNIADGIAMILGIFGGRFDLSCLDAADTNDDGAVDIGDALATFHFSFGGGRIPYPGPAAAGPDLTCDGLDCLDGGIPIPAVVLNEIHYGPLDRQNIDNQLLEFLELHNRTAVDVDIGGQRLADGIRFTFPKGTVVPPGGFLLVVRDPTQAAWATNPAPRLGPYEGALDDGGERLSLRDGDCLLETVTYDDRPPWPLGPDGYGPSLERVDHRAHAHDVHSWRSSLVRLGTPGAANSVAGIPPRPLIAAFSVEPPQPTSRDSVRVTLTLDAPVSAIRRATLRWERLTNILDPPQTIELAPAAGTGAASLLGAVLPPGPSQSVARFNLQVELETGEVVTLPHPSDPAPVLSYFIYDGEIEARLPICWLFPPRVSGIVPVRAALAAVVVKEAGSSTLALFDGARVRAANPGLKVTFLKGAEYRGDRTLNILPERGGDQVVGGVGGPFAPHLEYIGYQTYRDLGALAPEPRWFRFLNFSSPNERHTQRVFFQQVNERFFALNGLDPEGDIYKLEHGSFSKRNHLETGTQPLLDLLEGLNSSDPSRVRDTVLERLDLRNVALHSAVSVLLAHNDNYRNNLFLYLGPSPVDRWRLIPWDLDTSMQGPVPLSAPYGGLISGPFHRQAELDGMYREAIRDAIAPGGEFTLEAVETRIQSMERLLLEDLALQEAYMGIERTERRETILGATEYIRSFAAASIASLRGQLP